MSMIEAHSYQNEEDNKTCNAKPRTKSRRPFKEENIDPFNRLDFIKHWNWVLKDSLLDHFVTFQDCNLTIHFVDVFHALTPHGD